MARTKQTARKSTGGRAPRRPMRSYGGRGRGKKVTEEEEEEEEEIIDANKVLEITKMNRKELIKALTEQKQSVEGLRKALELRLIRHLTETGQLNKATPGAPAEEDKKKKSKPAPEEENESGSEEEMEDEEEEPPRKKRK